MNASGGIISDESTQKPEPFYYIHKASIPNNTAFVIIRLQINAGTEITKEEHISVQILNHPNIFIQNSLPKLATPYVNENLEITLSDITEPGFYVISDTWIKKDVPPLQQKLATIAAFLTV